MLIFKGFYKALYESRKRLGLFLNKIDKILASDCYYSQMYFL